MPDFFVLAALLPKIFGTKILLDIHDPMPSTYQTKFSLDNRSFLYKLLIFEELVSAKFADKVITVHEPIKNDVLVKDGIPINKIEVVANFADESKFQLIEKYNFDKKLKLVFHGTIAERSGFEYVIKELNLVRDLNFSFTIIGEGDYSDKLRQLIQLYNLENKVKFDNQFYPVDVLPNILSNYNLGLVSYKLSPATEYMLPLKFLEYTSLGLPSICVMNRALSYYFDKNDAFYFNSDENYGLSNIIKEILDKPTLLLQKRERIIQIRKNFYWKSQSEKYNEIVKNLIED